METKLACGHEITYAIVEMPYSANRAAFCHNCQAWIEMPNRINCDCTGMGVNVSMCALHEAAPAMYEALIELLPYAEKAIKEINSKMVGALYPYINQCKIDRARAALSQARGEK